MTSVGSEGAMRLGLSKELVAAPDRVERENYLIVCLRRLTSMGRRCVRPRYSTFELYDVIDPADSRAWITRLPGG
jgi:hypothetical protein